MRNYHLMTLFSMATWQWEPRFSWLLRKQQLFSESQESSSLRNSAFSVHRCMNLDTGTINAISCQKYMVFKSPGCSGMSRAHRGPHQVELILHRLWTRSANTEPHRYRTELCEKRSSLESAGWNKVLIVIFKVSSRSKLQTIFLLHVYKAFFPSKKEETALSTNF